MEFLNEVSQRIKFFRKEKGLTQEALAQKADIDISFLGKIERGVNNNISLETLNKIIEALDVEYADFFVFSDIERFVGNDSEDGFNQNMKEIANIVISAENRIELLDLLKHVLEVAAK